MKIIVQQKELAIAVKLLQRVLPRKNSNPVLTMIQLQLKAGLLLLRSTDLMTSLELVIPAQSTSDEGEWLLSGKIFSESVLMLDSGETSLEFEEERLVMKNGTDRVVISLMKEGDFPKMAEMTAEGEKMEVKVIQEIADKVVFATSTDISRPQLTGVDLRFNADKLNMVGTDGFRLSILELENFSNNLTAGEEILVAARSISDLLAIAGAFDLKKVELKYDEEEKRLMFCGDEFTYQASLIGAAFPPYERIIPLEFQTEIELNREELLQILNKALVFARESSNVVRIDFSSGQQAKIVARGVSGEYEGEIDILRLIGQGSLIAFNLKYLTDYLNVIESETVWLGMNEVNKPVLMSEEKNSSLKYIVMPFKARD